MFLIKIYIKESYINYYHTIIQMCGQYCILAPNVTVHKHTYIQTYKHTHRRYTEKISRSSLKRRRD